MLCPVCKVELKMTDRQGVEIDYCPQCRGVWLDRGELDKIIERSTGNGGSAEPRREQAAYPPPAPAAPPVRYDDDDDDYKYRQGQHPQKKRKSFLDDLFDF